MNPITLLDIHSFDEYEQAVEDRDSWKKKFLYANLEEIVYHPHKMDYDYKDMNLVQLLEYVARKIFGSFYPKEA